MNMYNLLKGARESLKEQLEYNAELDGEDIYFPGDEGDTIFEVCDSSIPVYTSDLMQLAADDINLAVNEPELGPAFDGAPTPVNIVAANVFDAIQEHLYECLEDVKEEIHQELLLDKEDNEDE